MQSLREQAATILPSPEHCTAACLPGSTQELSSTLEDAIRMMP